MSESQRGRAGEVDHEHKKIEGGEIRFHFTALDDACSRRRPNYAVNELPQPQPPVEFGFLNVKPEPCIDVT